MLEHELCANLQLACSSLSIRKEHASFSKHGFCARACDVGCISGRVHCVYGWMLTDYEISLQRPFAVGIFNFNIFEVVFVQDPSKFLCMTQARKEMQSDMLPCVW